MNASELRIGNWVYGALDQPYKVNVTILSALEANVYYVSPIPITPEILEAAGFETVRGELYKINGYWYDLKDKTFGSFAIENGEPIAENIKSLHQLQNLYFALTGEELTVNMPVIA